MLTALAFLAAAAIAAIIRGLVATTAWRVVAINIGGSFALGLLADVGGSTFTVLGVGALGAFTTFSSFVGHVGEAIEGTPQRVSAQAAPARSGPPLSEGLNRSQGGLLLVVGSIGGVAAAMFGMAL